jgi:hypothetical protein
VILLRRENFQEGRFVRAIRVLGIVEDGEEPEYSVGIWGRTCGCGIGAGHGCRIHTHGGVHAVKRVGVAELLVIGAPSLLVIVFRWNPVP